MTGSDDRPARRWRLWQIESAVACNLRCVMCPWEDERQRAGEAGLMSEEVWAAIRPHLPEIASIDFSGGGEPLLLPALVERVREAKRAGCTAGLLTNAVYLDDAMADELIDAGIDWITVSIDGPDRESYEAIRIGAHFDEVVGHLRRLAERRAEQRPRVGINFVMLPTNIERLDDMVRLAADLGVDQLNFKQADVVRGEYGRGLGLFAAAKKERRAAERALTRARRLAKRLGLETRAFSFEARELPVCEQDPRDALFVRYDGAVSACINKAYGGPITFFGEDAVMPTVHYGRLGEQELEEIWEGAVCRTHREVFAERCQVHDAEMMAGALDEGLSRLSRAQARARERMPAAPSGCGVCHYLYDV